MDFENRSIVSLRDFNKKEILHILEKTKEMDEKDHPEMMKGKVLATLFFEPSTRTRLSFESAMNRLGGKVIGFSDASVTSTSKGETLSDTIKMVSGYADVIAMRHPLEGAARRAAESTKTPIINGGDGANQHPTQTFLDLYTILKEKGTLENLSIGFLGDLKYGRTVHSLAHAMSLFGAKMFFIAPKSLAMPADLLEELKKAGIEYVEETDLFKCLPKLDIIYNTRIQKERFPDPLDYLKVKGAYVLDKKILPHVKKDMKILHPLPRVDELSEELDDTTHAVYFKQARNGVPTRQALIGLVTGVIK